MIESFMDGMKVAAFVLGFMGALILIPGLLILMFGLFSMVLQWVTRK